MKRFYSFSQTSLKFTAAFALLSLLSFKSVYAQKDLQAGYIITNAGDTIKGLINNKDWAQNPSIISFMSYADAKETKYQPLDIQGFEVGDALYRSGIVKVNKGSFRSGHLTHSKEIGYEIDTVFIQALIVGEKSLYYLKDKNNIEQFYIWQNDDFTPLDYKIYSVVENGSSSKRRNEKYKGQLRHYFNDCPDLNNKIMKTKHAKSSLVGLFKDYYACKDTPVAYEKPKAQGITEIGLMGGVSQSSLRFVSKNDFKDLVRMDYPTSKNYALGLFLDYSFPSNHNKWSLNNELLYTSYEVKGEFTENPATSYYRTIQTSIGYSHLNLNNMLRYKHPISKAFVFVNVGITNGLTLSETNYIRRDIQNYDNTRTEEDKALEVTRKVESGLLAGVGVKYNRFLIEVRQERSNGMSKFVGLGSPRRSSYLLAGFRF